VTTADLHLEGEQWPLRVDAHLNVLHLEGETSGLKYPVKFVMVNLNWRNLIEKHADLHLEGEQWPLRADARLSVLHLEGETRGWLTAKRQIVYKQSIFVCICTDLLGCVLSTTD
jgi:hypothetical protein